MNDTISVRQAHILALVVREYAETAQPVASAQLVQRYELAYSPATVRHELAALEEAGYLTHPHTSAGRVPTVAGYRYFVENLMRSAALPASQRRAMRLQLAQAGGDAERWLQLSAALIAQTSGMAGLVAAPPRLYHAGLMHILYQPEFENHDLLRGVVAILEEGDGLADVIAGLPASGVQVVMGGEPPLERVPHVTLVLARFGHVNPAPAGTAAQPGATPTHTHPGANATTGGVLGVVGPTRLAYEKAVPTVTYMARLMTELFGGEVQDNHDS